MSFELPQDRGRLIAAIQLHINDVECMSFADVELVAELVWALSWSRETRQLAFNEMSDVVKLNMQERNKEQSQ